MPQLNPLLSAVQIPPIPEAHAWAARYCGAHGPAIDLCQAVPGYPPHPELLDHLARAAAVPAHAKYGLINGDLDLRETYAAELTSTYGGGIAADQVAITAGCNQAFFVAMVALAQTGDNVLLPLPWFWNHQQTCAMLGIEPRALPCRATDGFVPDPTVAATLIDDRTRAIVLITPNNPTGAVYPPETIAAFHDLCRERGIALIMDETYRDFLPDGQARAHDLFTRPDWDRDVIQLYSFSKAYCVPGARLGAITAGAEMVGQCMKVLDCMHICPQRPAQSALRWAIEALPAWRAGNRALINARAATLRGALAEQPDWAIASIGSYFAYVRHPFTARPAACVAETMASKFGAVCLPGSAFGPEQTGYLRLAFANADATELQALASRLSDWREHAA